MTYFYYNHRTWNTDANEAHIPESTIDMWKHVSKKSNWRITELPNGYFQTECKDLDDKETWKDVTRRETIEGAERAIDSSIDHYQKKLKVLEGPKVVKTFK
tara:strand:+ start:67 stop:369 length:303 start_codon:yes stop_codon:yes gene_type:complete